LQDLQERKNVA